MGILLGGSLIYKGISAKKEVDSTYTEENKQNTIVELQDKIDQEKANLKAKKEELIGKGISYDAFTNYDDGEAYDLKIITNVLDPSFVRCGFSEYDNNSLTKKYCSLKSELEEVERTDMNFEKGFNSQKYIPYFMFGGFIIVASLMISASIFTFAKRREILAFTTQQVMPVAREGMEKMAPTIGKVGSEISKAMAPAYGEIAKEISKGIKDGIKDNDEEK